jgi:error-prone DNA polymerase
MASNGITGATADDIYTKIKAFSAFGFPESHSISFAFLAIASSWLKLHYPAEFLTALLLAQPMGFYSPQSLVHDTRRHGVTVHPPDINLSVAQADLEPMPDAGDSPRRRLAVRLGLAAVRSINDNLAAAVVADRDTNGPYRSMNDLAGRVRISTEQMEALATAGAFSQLGLSRREALWGAAIAATRSPEYLDIVPDPGSPLLPAMSAGEQLAADVWATGITSDYPTTLIRDRLNQLGVTPTAGLHDLPDRTRVTVGGVVTHRQRPPSAGGITFLSLEDETGILNVVVPQVVWNRYHQAAQDSGALLIRGMLERGSGAVNVVAERIKQLHLAAHGRSRDFR